jgi:amidase
VVRKLDMDELKHFAQGHHFSIAPGDEAQFKILSDALIAILDPLEVQEVDTTRILEAVRDPGRPPEPGEDPYNAIVRWCSVQAPTSGILSGKRIALKDSIGVASIPLTCGSRVL